MRCWVLAALAVLAAAPGAAEEPALRLCGREFIRTLVALCGGTRWSRPPRAAFADLFGRLDGHGPPSVAPPGPAGSCCSHGCTRQELLPFC
ncbi:insulin-like 3 [Anser cygnoides]|uniref:insulin-like 3 n=1 Tax=Anser cygnoides TaxID=8845 RepID=UPI0020091023|nr:insulin-like 3 [Anser cygnoides]